MKPARRQPGPRPRARSTSERQAAIWAAICAQQEWTSPEIAADVNCPLNTVHQYVAALARAGFVRCIAAAEPTQLGATPARWRTHWRARKLTGPPIVTSATRTARPQGEPTPP